jgi:hypothetical protein
MKGSIRSLALIAGSIVAASSGCGDRDTITGPTLSSSETASPQKAALPRGERANVLAHPRGVAPMTVEPRPTASVTIPPPDDLTGTWSGTITFYVNPEEGEEPCEKAASITVNLVESGTSLTGQFAAGCHGTLVLSGTIVGAAQLFGWLGTTAGGTYGRVNGVFSSKQIRFRTIVDLVGDGDEPDSDRDDNYVATRVELSR